MDLDNFNKELTEVRWKAGAYRTTRRLPSLPTSRKMKSNVELYDQSDEWVSVHERSDMDGLYFAFGTSGNRFRNTPVVGKIMTDLMSRCEAGHAHDADPIKFKLEHMGRTINLCFYSRKLEINQDRSFSVIG